MTSQIVHVITGLGVGGAEAVLCSFLSGLTTTERTSHLVVCLGGQDKMGDKISALGVKVEYLGLKRGRPTFNALFKLVKIFRSFDYPIIQGWLYHGNLAASCAAVLSFKRHRLLWSIHNSLTRIEQEKPLTKFIIYLLKFLSFLPQKIIYVARLSATQHEAIGYLKNRTMLITNGYDTSVFKPDPYANSLLRESLAIPNGIKIIGVVGRWDWSKDHKNFLSALKGVDGAHGVLIGTNIDSDNKELMTLIEQAGLRERVHLLGCSDDVPSLMPGFDILCLPSRAEALPNVVGEAMACGVPCVVTDVGDVAELVGETGWVCRPQDSNDLCSKINQALLSDISSYAAAARKRIATYYSYNNMINLYKSLYDWKAVI